MDKYKRIYNCLFGSVILFGVLICFFSFKKMEFISGYAKIGNRFSTYGLIISTARSIVEKYNSKIMFCFIGIVICSIAMLIVNRVIGNDYGVLYILKKIKEKMVEYKNILEAKRKVKKHMKLEFERKVEEKLKQNSNR